MGKGGGGGSSGKISFPAYMQDKHEAWLDEIEALVDAQVSFANPYSLAAAHDPDLALADTETRYDVYDAKVTPLSNETDFEDIMDKAVSEVNAHLDVDAAAVTAAVAAYETEQKPVLMRGLNRVAAGYAAVNATSGSSMLIGLALQETQYENGVAVFRARIEVAVDDARRQNIMRSAEMMVQMLYANVDSHQRATHLKGEINRVGIAAKREQLEEDLGIDVEDRLWDVKLYEHLGSFLGSIGGGSPTPDSPKRSLGSTVGGVISGVAAGAAVGAKFGTAAMPGLGTAIGAGIGGILGYLS